MTKKDFIEVEKENKYINNLLETHEKETTERIDSFFDGLREVVKDYGFIVCAHTRYDDIRVTVYDGIEEGSQKLTLNNFDVFEKTDNFNPLVLDLVEIWLRDVK